ncbi:hypothetical protein EBZ70_11260, partial [bacterium]|nr:hypothetical protein [bacterium]
MNAGTHTLTAVFRATDTTNYVSPVTNTVSLVVNKATNVINLAATDTKAFGADPYALVFTKLSTGALSYTSTISGVATISPSGEVTIRGAGQTTLKVSQAGDSNYEATPEVSQVLTVNSAGGITSDGSSLLSSTGGGSSPTSGTYSSSGAAPILELPATMTYGQKIALPGAVQGARVGESGLNLAIPDGSGVGLTRSLSLTNFLSSSYRLKVGLKIDQTGYFDPQGGGSLGDLNAYLRYTDASDPTNIVTQTRQLLSRVGKDMSDLLDSGSLAAGIDLIFSDTASQNIQNASDPLSGALIGTFQPASLLAGSGNGLSALGGVTWSGTWDLIVADVSGGGTMNLVDWFLQFEDLSSASSTADTTGGLVYEVLDTSKGEINGNELEAKSGTGQITLRARYVGSEAYTTNTIALRQASQTLTFTNRPVTVVSNLPYLFDPGAISSAGQPISYTSGNSNVATGQLNGVSIRQAGVSVLTASLAANDNYSAGGSANQTLTVLAPPAVLPFGEDFSSPGLGRLTPINYDWGSSLSLTADSFLANTNGRLTFSAPRSAAAIAQPNLTLPLTNSWTVEATVNVPNSTPYQSVGINIMRDLYQGGQYYPNDQLTLQSYSYNGNWTVRSYSLTQAGGSTVLGTNSGSVATLRLAMKYDHLTKQVSLLYRDLGNTTWLTNSVQSLATNGAIGTAWGLKVTDQFRVGFFAETQSSVGTAGSDLWVDDLYVQVQTLPELTLSGPLTGTVDAAISPYPVLYNGHPPIVFSASNLPTGLGIGSTDGIITGTPTAGGAGTATIYASNSYGVVSTNLVFNIARAASTITVTGTNSFTFSGNPQGPVTVSKTGSQGSVTYSYAGTNGTTYLSNATKPTDAGQYTVVASVAADSNYEAATALPFSFTIAKATPTISAAPTASAITYGQTLADSNLTGGTASTGGTFAFTTTSTAPNVGTANQGVTFSPNDTANFNSATTSASVTVIDGDLPVLGADAFAAKLAAGMTTKVTLASLLANDRPSANPSDTRTVTLVSASSTSTGGGSIRIK